MSGQTVLYWNAHAINDGVNYNAYLTQESFGLPQAEINNARRRGRWPKFGSVERPDRYLYLVIDIIGASTSTLRKQLHQWFDPEDETPKNFVVADEGTLTYHRYVQAVCEQLEPLEPVGYVYRAALKISGDVRWTLETPNITTWSITGSGDTQAITNPGEDDAYPVYTITPTSGKASGFGYYRFVAVKWNALYNSSLYPVDICNAGFDTATLVGAGKMQADGDDLRVYVAGVEVDRWLDDINTANTKVWINLQFDVAPILYLKTAIAGAGAITDIELTGATGKLPAAGLVMIDNEIFSYQSKDDVLAKLSGVTRTARGTSAGAHSAAASVTWLQYDITIYYGNNALAAPTVDSSYEPMFELDHSTNTSWVYEEFLDGNNPSRPGSWIEYYSTPYYYAFALYGGNELALANPFAELGISVSYGALAGYILQNNCTIDAANFTNGEKRAQAYLVNWDATYSGIQSYHVSSSPPWQVEYAIAAPSAADAWEAWSQNETMDDGVTMIALFASHMDIYPSYPIYLEAADCTVTLDSTYTPTVVIEAEISNPYNLACTLSNSATGDSISLDYQIDLSDSLVIDTGAKTVTLLSDGSNQFQALTLDGGPRRDWLKLAVGSNTLTYTETGAAGVTVVVEFHPRWYN